MHSYLLEVTPDKAGKLLQTRKDNRPLSEKYAQQLAKDMANDRWMLTPQGLVLDEEGNVLDGQHRLRAVAISGRAITFWVTDGVPREVFRALDGGRPRTMANLMYIDREENYVQLAAIARRVCRWRTGQPWSVVSVPTKAELYEVIEADPLIRKAARFAHGWVARPAPNTAGFGWWLFKGVDDEDATWFMERLRDGAGLEDGNPVLTLRNWLNKPGVHGQFRRQEAVIGQMIICWNHWRRGESHGKLQSPRNPWSNENFPQPA
jgi:hypothetical protein